MAKYKGTIRFISDTNALALVEETVLQEDLAIADTLLGTGDNSIVTFSGTLQPVVEEGSLVLEVAGVDQVVTDYSLETTTGRTMFVAAGEGSATDGGFNTSVGLITSTGYAMLSSVNLTTSSGAVNIINYETGEILFSFGVAPTAGQAVTISYERGAVSGFPSGVKLLRGDFEDYVTGSTIYYDYSTGDVETTTISIKRTGEE